MIISLSLLRVFIAAMLVMASSCLLAEGVMTEEVVAEGAMAEVVWVGQAEEDFQILYREFANGKWSEQDTELYRSESEIVTPFITTESNGNKLLLWSEARGLFSMDLMIMRGVVDKNDVNSKARWSMPRRLSNHRDYNLAATAAVDAAGSTWVFWTAEDKNGSDVFQISYDGERWSAPVMAHVENKVPDLQPVAALQSNGELELTWSTYSFAVSKYVVERKRIEASSMSPAKLANVVRKLANNEELSDRDVPTPSFLPSSTQLIRLHFPNNLKQQFVSLDQ